MPTKLNPKFNFFSLSDDAILNILKQENLRLNIEETKKIQGLLKRPPTLSECVLWSIQGPEHCSYKSTHIHLKNLPTNAPNVTLGPKEDAGIVEVARDHEGHRYDIVMSHESHNHPSQIVPYEGTAKAISREAYDRKLDLILKEHQIDLIILLGFMRILSRYFTKAWSNQIINVHPSLPKYAGLMDLNVHEAALEAGDSESGCCVHFVEEEVDAGQVLIQKRCVIKKNETGVSLKAKFQALEVLALVEAIELLG